MQRYNAFGLIHETMRRVLNEAAALLQQADFSNAATCNKAVEAVVIALHLCYEHDACKSMHILTALVPFEPSVVATIEQDAILYRRRMQAVYETIAQLYRSKNSVHRQRWGSHLQHCFLAFLIVTRNNMAREEVLQRLLEQYCIDAELHNLQQAMNLVLLNAVSAA